MEAKLTVIGLEWALPASLSPNDWAATSALVGVGHARTAANLWFPQEGRLAQPEERHVHTVEVTGSKPVSPTPQPLPAGFESFIIPCRDGYRNLTVAGSLLVLFPLLHRLPLWATVGSAGFGPAMALLLRAA